MAVKTVKRKRVPIELDPFVANFILDRLFEEQEAQADLDPDSRLTRSQAKKLDLAVTELARLTGRDQAD